MNSSKRALKRTQEWAIGSPAIPSLFIATFVGTVVALNSGVTTFLYGDSGGYWDLGLTFVKNGSFVPSNFKNPVYGYSLPLFDIALHEIGSNLGLSDLVMVKFSDALVMAFLSSVVLPWFARIVWPDLHLNIVRRLLLMAALLIFWRGYLNFSLSDFPGITTSLLAVCFVVGRPSIYRAFGAGAFAALTINLRPSYLPILPILLVVVWMNWRGDRGLARQAKSISWPLLGLLLGALIVSAPQSLSTHENFDSWNPIPSAPSQLLAPQLTGGLELQRYETYVGTGHIPQMEYFDPATAQLLSSLPGKQVANYSQYVSLVVEHPMTMLGAISRRVINGLDQHYNTPYVSSIDSDPNWLDFADFTVIFLAIVRIVWKHTRMSLGRTRWIYILYLLAPCISAVLLAMETRFMLPAYVFAYLLVIVPGWRQSIHGIAWPKLRSALVGIAVTYVLSFGLWFAVISNTFVNLRPS